MIEKLLIEEEETPEEVGLDHAVTEDSNDKEQMIISHDLKSCKLPVPQVQNL
jgi:hypothetical protein